MTGAPGGSTRYFYILRDSAGRQRDMQLLDSATIAEVPREHRGTAGKAAYVQMVNGVPWTWPAEDDLVIAAGLADGAPGMMP